MADDGKMSEEEMRVAVRHRNAKYDGRFIYAVVTTGVFCKPSCPSRQALYENMRFYESTERALAEGYRPCKRCNPTEQNRILRTVIEIAHYLEEHVDEKVSLADLAQFTQMSPAYIQKIFKANMGLSPKVYHEALRHQLFREKLRQEGTTVIEAIFASGYESTSRAYEASSRLGMPPSTYANGGCGEHIFYVGRQISLGQLMIGATARGVCFAQFGNDSSELLSELEREFPSAQLHLAASKTSELNKWMTELEDYISSGGPKPNIPTDLRGTVFQMAVWRFLQGLADHQTYTYSEVAQGVKRPKAVRAVASACAANRVAVLVPCHLVLRKNGDLGEYRWGADRKRALIRVSTEKVTD